MKTKRLSPDVRSGQMLDTALKLAEEHGLSHLTKELVAKACGVSHGVVYHRFGTMPNFRRSIIRAAVKRENLRVLAEALIRRDPHVDAISPELRERALSFALKATDDTATA